MQNFSLFASIGRLLMVCVLILIMGSLNNTYAQSLCFDPATDNRYETNGPCMDLGALYMNGDTHLDIVAATGNSVAIHLGNGDGTFQTFYTNPVGTHWDIEMINFDGDGDLDFYSYQNGNLVAVRNMGNGNFEWAGYYALPLVSTAFSQMTAGNIDADVQPEIIINDNGSGLFIVQTNAQGIPVSSTVLNGTVLNPSSVKMGHLDDNNFMDLVVASSTSDNIAICLSNGDGLTFSTTVQNAGTAVGNGYSEIEITNLDTDADNEILVAGMTMMYVLKNEGNGSFTSMPDVFMGGYCSGFITGDWDDDGDNDVAWTYDSGGHIIINLNNGNGTFPSQGNLFYSSGGQAQELVGGDFDEDGVPDIVTANGFDNNIAFLKGQGDGSFGPQYLLAGYGASGLCAADFDNNGTIDILATNTILPSYMALSFNIGDGSFLDTEFLPTVNNAEECVSADFNEDGNQDVAIHSPQGFAIHLGNGDGTFEDYLLFESANTGDGGERTICTGDFDNDGNMDLAGSRVASDNVAVLYGNGDGTFGTADIYTDGLSYARTIIAAHLNNDNFEDMVICSNNSDQVYVYFGNATEDFDAPVILATPGNPEGLTAADFNEDGANDLIVVAPNANKCYFFAGNNNQTFDTATEFNIPQFSNATRGSHADINGDGHLDFVCALYQDDAVAIFFGNGDGTFESAVSYDVDHFPNRIITADFNNDGAVDFSTLNSGIFNVSVVLNNSAYVTADGDLAFCEGEDVVLTASEGYSYQWNNGATVQSITVNESGEYYCSITNQSGTCTLVTTSVEVEVFEQETVTLVLDSTVVCANSESFVLSGGWPIGGQYTGPGITANFFDPSAVSPGTYSITYTYSDTGGCTNSSATDEIVVELCDNVDEAQLNISVFPTLVSSEFTIMCNENNLRYRLLDINGKTFKTGTCKAGRTSVNMGSMSAGFYLLQLQSESVIKQVRLEKIN